MNKHKTLILTVLIIFCISIGISTVNATHVFKVGKYKGKLTNSQYNYLKHIEEVNNEGYENDEGINVKTGKYYVYKKTPIYKKKKVKKRKWIYKTKLASKTWYYSNGEYEYKSYKVTKPKGYKLYSIYSKYDNGCYKCYYKYRKKGWGWAIKKVKTGKYKKHKDPIYMYIGVSNGKGLDGKGVHLVVWSSKYWADHSDDIAYKHKDKL